MGQVSILEDIQKIKENLASLQGDLSRPPSEVLIKAQARRLEKERQRILELTVQLSRFICGVDEKLCSPDFTVVKNLIVRSDLKSELEALAKQKSVALQNLTELRREVKGISDFLVARKVYEAKSAAVDAALRHADDGPKAVLNVINNTLKKKLSTILRQGKELTIGNEAGDNLRLQVEGQKKRIRALEAEKSIITKNYDLSHAKIRRLQELLNKKSK